MRSLSIFPGAKQGKVQPDATSGDLESEYNDINLETGQRKLLGSASASLSSSRPNAQSSTSISQSKQQGEIVNQKALNIVQRVRDKLTGQWLLMLSYIYVIVLNYSIIIL